MQANEPANHLQRLYFFDWLRILAFFVLILYHTGMYYVTWDFHVKSPQASSTIEPLMLLTAPWRMGLLFMISGIATAFMLRKMAPGALLGQRSWRLLVPLVFGMLVIVPPQSYYEVVEKVAYQGSYTDFLRLYLSGYHGFCREDCLIMPTWNHLWFVAYLWVYTMLLGALVWLAMRLPGQPLHRLCTQLADSVGGLRGWKMIVIPAAVLAVARFALADGYPSTHALLGDWYNHAQYGFLFALGVLLALRARFWAEAERLRWAGLGLWLVCWALMLVYYGLPDTPAVEQWRPMFRPLMRLIYCLGQWTPIVAACGFARRHLNVDSARRRYLAEAVFPVYIVHQTLIIVMAHWLQPVGLAPALEGALLVILTVAISFAVFALVRRVTVLRPLFGLARAQTSAYARPLPATAASDGLPPSPRGQA